MTQLKFDMFVCLIQFKDMTVLPTLLELHTVVCSVPSSTLYSAETFKVSGNRSHNSVVSALYG